MGWALFLSIQAINGDNLTITCMKLIGAGVAGLLRINLCRAVDINIIAQTVLLYLSTSFSKVPFTRLSTCLYLYFLVLSCLIHYIEDCCLSIFLVPTGLISLVGRFTLQHDWYCTSTYSYTQISNFCNPSYFQLPTTVKLIVWMVLASWVPR